MSEEKKVVEEVEQDWYFTFGSGQRHENCFTIIHGTHNSAREEMMRRYGVKFSFQYPEKEGDRIREFQYGGEIK